MNKSTIPAEADAKIVGTMARHLFKSPDPAAAMPVVFALEPHVVGETTEQISRHFGDALKQVCPAAVAVREGRRVTVGVTAVQLGQLAQLPLVAKVYDAPPPGADKSLRLG